MGLFGWGKGKKEESPPEPLVLGAELICPFSGTSYLYVETDNIDINKLPQACVEDSVALYNILPFGRCEYLKASCSEWMEIDGIWENPEPQKAQVNGKEIITMKSQLACKHARDDFIIKSSGQNGVFAERLILIREIEEKYPGLLAILQDPNRSLYETEGMYEKGLQFLEDRLKAHGGEVGINIIAATSLEGELMRAAIARLLPFCESGDVNTVMAAMRQKAQEYDVDWEEEWDVTILNGLMLEVIRKDCEKIAREMKETGKGKWSQDHKLFVSELAKTMEAISMTAVMHQSMKRNQKKTVETEAREEEAGKKTVGKGEFKPDNPEDYLNEALERQGLDKTPKNMKESWTADGYKYEVRVHEANPEYGKEGSIYRVSRKKLGTNANGQGYGTEYLDTDGVWHHTSTLKPQNPSYNAEAAANTHIPVH